MPLPSEETTPPVTKMNFGLTGDVVMWLPLGSLPVGFGAAEVLGRVDPGERRCVEARDTEMNAVLQRAKLFQLLGHLERGRRQRHPRSAPRAGWRTHQGAASTVHPCCPRHRDERDRRAREVERPAVVSRTTLTRAGFSSVGGVSGVAALPTSSPARTRAIAPVSARGGEEGLVALDVHNEIEIRELGSRGDLGHSFGTGQMVRPGEDHPETGTRYDVGYFIGVGRDHQGIHAPDGPDPLRDPDHQGHSPQQLQGLPGQPRRTQTSGDDAEDWHSPS